MTSGIENWFGVVPVGWSVTALGWVADLAVPMRDKPTDLTGPIPWVRIEDFDGMYVEGSRSSQGVSDNTVAEMNLKVFPAGTVLCSCSCSMGATAIARVPLVSNQTFIGVTPHDRLESRYLFYLLASASAELQARATGAIQQYLSRNDFSTLRIPLPPRCVQSLIADYLDSETARIDALIDRKQRFIDLLLEKRTALITQAVTKGLNPDAEVKDSGALWLGGVPAHWDVKPNKYLLKLHQRSVGDDSGAYVLLSLTLRGLIRRDIESGAGKWPSSFDTYQVVRAGELVFCLFDVDETPRTVGFAKETGMVTGAYTVAECLPPVAAKFIYYLFISFDSDKRLKPLYSGLRKVIRPDRFLSAKMPAPSRKEQQAIVEYLDEQTAKIDGLVEKTSCSIDLLREYRTALISAAVTGQIDIPGTETSEDVA